MNESLLPGRAGRAGQEATEGVVRPGKGGFGVGDAKARDAKSLPDRVGRPAKPHLLKVGIDLEGAEQVIFGRGLAVAA